MLAALGWALAPVTLVVLVIYWALQLERPTTFHTTPEHQIPVASPTPRPLVDEDELRIQSLIHGRGCEPVSLDRAPTFVPTTVIARAVDTEAIVELTLEEALQGTAWNLYACP